MWFHLKRLSSFTDSSVESSMVHKILTFYVPFNSRWEKSTIQTWLLGCIINHKWKYQLITISQYPFRILYLPTQIQMHILYRKPGFKREFSRFSDVQIYIIIWLVLYLKLKIPYTQHEFLALNTYLSSFSKKTQMYFLYNFHFSLIYFNWKLNIMIICTQIYI